MTFRYIESSQDIAASFPVMRELRPHLDDADIYRQRVERQQTQGYRLLGLYVDGEIAGLAGYRHLENLIYGRFTYLDDLVVRGVSQRSNVGTQLVAKVRAEATADGQAMLVLDTGIANALAQRFYFRNGLLARGLHFSQPLEKGAAA